MWQLTTSERLETWKSLRHHYESLDFETALSEVTKLWSFAPFVNHYLEYQTPGSWPDPWALLAENYYCDLAKTLGMLYTLYLGRHGRDHDYAIRIMVRPENKDIYNLVWVDQGKYVLNYDFSEIVNTSRLDPNLVELRHYTSDDLRLDRYT